MRRTLASAAAALILLMAAPEIQAAPKDWRWDECRFQGLQRGVWTATEERLTAQCVLSHWSVPGGLAKLTAVIACESGWNRLAYNPHGPYLGLAQHAGRYWIGRVNSYEPAAWDKGLSRNWRNSRAQLVVTARMVHAGGWTPWACA